MPWFVAASVLLSLRPCSQVMAPKFQQVQSLVDQHVVQVSCGAMCVHSASLLALLCWRCALAVVKRDPSRLTMALLPFCSCASAPPVDRPLPPLPTRRLPPASLPASHGVHRCCSRGRCHYWPADWLVGWLDVGPFWLGGRGLLGWVSDVQVHRMRDAQRRGVLVGPQRRWQRPATRAAALRGNAAAVPSSVSASSRVLSAGRQADWLTVYTARPAGGRVGWLYTCCATG